MRNGTEKRQNRRATWGKGLRDESVGSRALPLSKPRSLKIQSGLRLEGPRAALSSRWVSLCVRVGVGGQRPGEPVVPQHDAPAGSVKNTYLQR